MDSSFLRSILAGESRAYGFTIAFWGSGILLIQAYGMPQLPEILGYGFGAVAGFGLISVLAFRQAFNTVEYERPQYLVLSMVHYLAALAPIVVTNYLTWLEPMHAFFFSGMAVSVVYNLVMLVEEYLAEEARILEERLIGI
jgi:hypothetical protein